MFPTRGDRFIFTAGFFLDTPGMISRCISLFPSSTFTFFSPAALFEKENSLSFFDTLKLTFLTGTQLLSLGSKLNDSLASLDDLGVFACCFFPRQYGKAQSSFKLVAAFNGAWHTFDSERGRGSSFATNSAGSSSITGLCCWWTAGCFQQGDSQSRACRCLDNNFPFFWRSGFLLFTPSCQSSFDNGNLVFSPVGLCNYVQDAYRLLREMPLKHLHSAKVHIRVPHLAARAHNH